MTFPTIPTLGAGRILVTSNTAGGAGGVKTFPNLSSLTKNAGDLLIAIAVIYDGNSTNAEFSSWGGSFNEFVDQATTATMGIGCAYKFSDGTEAGTFTVTTADTSTNDSQLILLSIPGAHASTPPEGGTIANNTSAGADVGSLNPGGWDAEDTLWIWVGGCGETSTTGSFTGVTVSPTNFGSDHVTSITADVVGGINVCLGFRQLNASSLDPGAGTVDTSNARNSAVLLAVRPAAAVPGSVTPGVIARSATIPAATVKGAGRTTPGAISRSVVVPAATAKGAAIRVPDVVARSVVIPQASAADSGAPGSVTPDVTARAATIPAPTVQGSALVGPAVISRVVSVHSPTLTGGAKTEPAVIARTAVIPQATGQGGVTTVTPATTSRTAALGTVTLKAGATATPGAIATAATLPTVLARVAATASPDTILVVVEIGEVTASEGDPAPSGTAQDGDLLIVIVDGKFVVSGLSGSQAVSNASGGLRVGSQG